MKVQIKEMILEFFKGVRNATYKFSDSTNVYGENGLGKSTIATAFYWLLFDKSAELVSNPPIRPDNVEECVPRVDIVLDVDGKEVNLAKYQKQKVKEDKDKGTRTVSLTNSYEINGVEKSKRDFDAYLTDLGIDMDKFLLLSHPNVFTSGLNSKKEMEQMRALLFEMTKSYTDKEIAEMLPDMEEVLNLMDNYTIDEIAAMQNSTIRKIKENYGKDGEILRAEIKAKEELKVDIDVAELELGRNVLKEMIADNQAKQNDVSKQYEEFQNISAEIIQLKMKLNDIQRNANSELDAKKHDYEMELLKTERELDELKFNATKCEKQLSSNRTELSIKNVKIQDLRDELKVAKERKFDENNLICPYCKQEYTADKKEQIKADFESTKIDECKSISQKGIQLKEEIEQLTKEIAELNLTKADFDKKITVTTNTVKEIKEKITALPMSIDVSDNDEYKAISKDLEDKQAIYNKGFDNNEIKANLKAEEEDLQNQLLETERKIASSERNVEIDEQILELLEKQKKYEQDKANAEKILEQLKCISKKKNELLVDGINSHFEIVDFKLFDYQKNGEYKEVCIPMIDRKTFGQSTNTGREVLAKLDIIKGLHKFYEQNYPVFLDNAECLSEKTKKRVNSECQIIYLNVSEDENLRIEV